MTKEEQIEEIAGVICESEIDDGIVFGDVYELEFAEWIGRNLIEKGYRKADEVRQETAREILQRLLFERTTFVDDYGEVSYAVFIEKIKEVAAEYGVEVEE